MDFKLSLSLKKKFKSNSRIESILIESSRAEESSTRFDSFSPLIETNISIMIGIDVNNNK